MKPSETFQDEGHSFPLIPGLTPVSGQIFVFLMKDLFENFKHLSLFTVVFLQNVNTRFLNKPYTGTFLKFLQKVEISLECVPTPDYSLRKCSFKILINQYDENCHCVPRYIGKENLYWNKNRCSFKVCLHRI